VTDKTIITEPIDEPINEIDLDFEVSGRAEMKKLLSFEDLVEVTVSLINEPFEPPPLSARQKATQRWRLV
jgi:hypothetical protein